MIKNLLDSAAYETAECCDGDEVAARYSILKPDWVLMDIKMKNMDGIKATSELIKHFPEAKVMMITNYADDDIKEKSMKAGAIEFIDKENLSGIISILQKYSEIKFPGS